MSEVTEMGLTAQLKAAPNELTYADGMHSDVENFDLRSEDDWGRAVRVVEGTPQS